jgi:hypothetical protein
MKCVRQNINDRIVIMVKIMTIIVVNDVRYGMKVKGITRIESRTEGLLATNQLGTLQSQKGENCCAP